MCDHELIYFRAHRDKCEFKEEFAEGHRRSWIGVRKEVKRETLYSYVKVLQAGQVEEEKKKPTIRLLGDRAIKSYQ